MDLNSSVTQPGQDAGLVWYAIQTPLGTTVFKHKGIFSRSIHLGTTKVVEMIDACSVIQRPSICYVAKGDTLLQIYSPDEALKLGYVDAQGRELEEAHGDMVDDYVPMYPDSSPGINETILFIDKIIFLKCLGDRPDLDAYVAQKLGRTPVKAIDAPTKNTTEQRPDEQGKG